MQDRFDICLDGLLPDDGGAVLLAVSGGVDSMVMADLFLHSRHKLHISLAHCNFHLRGDESDGDEAFVERWAADHGIPFFKEDFDTAGEAASRGISIEMAARELRYAWFDSLCSEEGFNAVAVAHNANDNAETLILNLLRGTGLKGICGMKEKSLLQRASSASLIRPLLSFSRTEIHEYALSRGLQWREDSTNADSSYKRNLIRNEVFPLFERINPSFLDTLNSDMRRFSQVQAIADDHFAEYVRSAEALPSGGVRVDVPVLTEKQHWEYLLFRILEPYGFNESVLNDLTKLIKDGKTFSGRRFLSPEYVAITSRNSITIMSEGDVPSADEVAVVIPGPGRYSLDGIEFEVEVVEIEDPRQPEGVTVANLGFPFSVRRWQEGDWMRPLGMGGRRKKLSDMFNDLKFSSFQKEKALVIADEGSHVLALIGYRIDESVALSSQYPPRRPFSGIGREALGGEGDVVTTVRIRLT